MGMKGGKAAQVETPVTPAIARTVAADDERAQQAQIEARQRLRGIRSTYASFNEGAGAGLGTRLG